MRKRETKQLNPTAQEEETSRADENRSAIILDVWMKVLAGHLTVGLIYFALVARQTALRQFLAQAFLAAGLMVSAEAYKQGSSLKEFAAFNLLLILGAATFVW